MAKTIVIIAVTGNQGYSVAEVFLKLPDWNVKGVTRNLSSPKALDLIKKGVELVQGDTNDRASINAAVQGASIVFGNTVWSDALVNPASADLKHLKPGQDPRKMCYELELSQGKNVADAVATVKGLELFIWSSLSDASKWSHGKYTGVYHFDSKAHVVEYIKEKYPELSAKMSLLVMGLFVTNWKWGGVAVPWKKLPDGTFRLRVPGSGDVPIPLVVPQEAGNFVKALAFDLPAGTNLLAYSDRLKWADYVKLLSETTGLKCVFEKCTLEEHASLDPRGQGMEMAEMYGYAQDFGYEAEADKSVTYSGNVVPKIPCTSIKDYIKGEDWSQLGL